MKNTVYVFGHKNPDTDSVTSAITLAYLKNQLGMNAEARVLGSLNKESKFVLNYFKVKEPKYLDSVRLQIKDVDYYKGFTVNEHTTILETYNYFKNNLITGAPVVDSNKKLKGIVTSKDITRILIENEDDYISTSYDNILKVLKGKEILKFDEEINGEVLVASNKKDVILENYKFVPDTILIVGGRFGVINHALQNKVKLLILVSDYNLESEQMLLARQNKINVISTSFNSLKAARKVMLSDYVKNLMSYKHFCRFNENFDFYDFIKEANKLGHNNYPVVDNHDNCLGLIRVTDQNKKYKKEVILVDHNEEEQSVYGLNEASVIEVVDHHNISKLSTSAPISFRTMAVGCTNTIIYLMYQEQNVKIPYDIAGLMLSGILSDTLSLTSATTTELDKKTVKELSELINIDYNSYYKEMLKAGTSIDGLTKLEVLTQDYKQYQAEDKKYAVAQTITLDIDSIIKNKQDFLNLMEDRKTRYGLDFMIFMITDVIKNGSYLLYTTGCEDMLEEVFRLENVKQGIFVDAMTSRKKQVIPYLDLYLK